MKVFERRVNCEDIMNLAVSFITDGKISIEKMRKSLETVVKNNDIFRYTVDVDGDMIKYIWCDYIAPVLDVIDVKDETEASILMRNIVRYHSSEMQKPCWEFHLYRISEERHIFFGKFSHSCMDGTAIKIFIEQLINIYNDVPVEFSDNYTEYLESLSSSETLSRRREMENYWENENKGHKQFVDVKAVSEKTCSYEPFFEVSRNVVKSMARKYKTSNAMIFLYVYSLAVAVSYGVDDVDVITMVNGRTKNFQNTLGKFISGSFNRVIFSEDKGIIEMLKENKTKLMRNLQLAELGYKYKDTDPFLLTYQNNASLEVMKLGNASVYPNADTGLGDGVDAELIMLNVTETPEENIMIALNASFDIFSESQRELFKKVFSDGLYLLDSEDITFKEFAERYKK